MASGHVHQHSETLHNAGSDIRLIVKSEERPVTIVWERNDSPPRERGYNCVLLEVLYRRRGSGEIPCPIAVPRGPGETL